MTPFGFIMRKSVVKENITTLVYIVERMAQSWAPELGKSVLIVHGDCPEYAEGLKAQVAARFPEAEIEIDELGPVIGAHTGPGLLALIYWGSSR